MFLQNNYQQKEETEFFRNEQTSPVREDASYENLAEPLHNTSDQQYRYDSGENYSAQEESAANDRNNSHPIEEPSLPQPRIPKFSQTFLEEPPLEIQYEGIYAEESSSKEKEEKRYKDYT